MRKHLHKLFAISMAMALGLGAAAQTFFQATVPSGQSLIFEVTSPTTCQLSSNISIGGSATDSLIIPYTVSDGTNTYQVTAIGGDGICDFLGRGTLILPNSITRIERNGINNNDFDTIIFPAGLNFMDNGAVERSARVGSGSVLVFRSATPPVTTSGYFNAFTQESTADHVRHIYVPAGQTAAYESAFWDAFISATLHEWGTSTPTEVDRYDTIHPGEVRWINNRPYDGTYSVRDSSLYYTHNLITRVHLQAVQWHFYANAPTGQRLYYHITGTDSVEVVAPNGSGWAYYTPPTDSLAIPATVTHDGHTYSVFRIANRAFYRCDAITALTLPEGIAEVGTEAIFIMTSRELRVSLPRSLRIINDYAFNTNAFNSRLKLASDTIWAEVIGREAFFPKVISQPLVLPNVRTIGDKGFYRIGSCPYLWVGDSCTSIGEQAFAETTSVPIGPIPGRISLGTSLQTVGASAFSRPNGYPIHSVEFRGTTVPSFAASVFKNTQIDSIITPCGTSAAYRAALDAAPVNEGWDPSNTVFQERGCPVNVYLYDTLFYAMGPVTFAGRSITSPGEYRDTIHLPGYDSINILVVSEAHYSFSVDTLGNRLWYRIIGTDRVAVVPPNTVGLPYSPYSGYTEPSGNLDIPDTVRHGGTAYAVVQVGEHAFHQCDSLDGYISLPPTIDTIGYEAFARCTAVKKLVIPASVNFFNQNCFGRTMTAGQNDTLVFLGSDASRLSTWTSMFGGGSRWDSKILVPCGSMAAYSAVRSIPAAYLQEYGCTVVVHIYDTMCVGATYHWANKAIISGGTFYDTVHRPLYDSVTILHLVSEGNWNIGGGSFPEMYCETSLPFTWHEQYIDAPGDYTHDERVLTTRGCWLKGKKFEMTVFQRPHTYVYDTVRSTAKGYDYSDTTETTVPVNSYPCRDSLVTTITWHDLDETTDTVRTILYDTACAGSFYRFGGRGLLSSGTYYDTVHMPFRDSITILHLNFEGSASVTFHNPDLDCESNLPFTWHGQYIDAPGNYTSDERVFSPRGCYISGEEHYLRVVPLPHTYLYDTVVSAAKGNDYSDTVTVVIHRSMPVMGATCIADSLVTTYTWHDFDETTDTVRTILYDTICRGTIYHFGGRYLLRSDTYYDTVRMPFRDSITVLHLEVEGTMANSLHTEVICETSLPYIWDGDTITTPGTHHLDHSVFNPRGCLMSGNQLQLTVVPRAKTYIYDTVVSTAKGYDYDDTTKVSMLRQGSHNSPCPDSLVTTYTHYDLDESVDTLRVYGSHQQCDGTYLFGGIERTATGIYTDTVVVDPFHVTISTLDLTINYSSTGDTAAVVCDAFTWHGTTYTTSAAPQHVYTNAAGCDSTVTLALTVNYSNTGDTAAVVCDAFTWHGTTYTASAAPQHVYTNAAGCDSTVTLALTVNYSNTGDTAAVVCDAFTWHGTTYTASAAPQHVYTNAAGCDSTVTLALTVNYSNTGDTAAVACDAFTWHGTTYTASAAPQYVYTNAAGCDSTVTLALTVNYSNTGDTAAVACDAFTWHGVDYTASAAPQHVYTNAAGCDSTVTLALTVNYSNTGDTAAVACDAFTWHGTTYTASAAPQYVYTNAAGCDSTVTLALTINYSNTGDTAAVVCDDFTWHGTTYTASAAPQHVYTNTAGCDSTVTLALTVNYSSTGDTAAVACDAFTWHGVDYTASAAPQHVYTNAAGCDSTVTLALTVNYSNTGDTAAVACDAFTWHGTTYTASAAPQHVYTNAAGCDSTVTLALTVNYSNTGDTAAVACDAFTWHGVDYTASAAPQHVYTNAAGCDSTVTLALTVNYSNTGDTAAVACDAFTWHGTTYTASAAPQHVYTNAAGCDSTVTLALTVNYSNTGTETADVCDEYTWQGTTYTVSNTTDQVVLTNVAGCDSTVTLNLTVRHSSVGDTAAVAFDIFTWYGHTYRATTTATHTLTNAEGCDSTVTLSLTILESYSTDAAFGENGIEVEAYGYCAGPGAVRYRLSSGQPNEYRLAFAHAAFPAAGWTPITTPGSIDIEVPAGLATGDYSAVLQFRHSSWPELTSAAIPVVIHVNLPETYVQPLFNDVIALVDTCQCLTDVQWYHREAGETEWTLIPGANDYYYHQEGGLTGEYFVSAKMNGVETYTCPQSDMGTLITDGNITLTAYPNPTASVITLTLDGSRRASHEVRVLTTTGIELERRSFEGDSLQMDLSAYPRGSYIVSVDGMAVRVIRN